jgi:hypothetical protein
MFENIATQDPTGFLTAVTEQLAKLPSQLWRTGNDGFAPIAGAMDALAVQLECSRVGLVAEAESRGVVAASSAPCATDWLLASCLHLEPADAARTVDLAHHLGQGQEPGPGRRRSRWQPDRTQGDDRATPARRSRTPARARQT